MSEGAVLRLRDRMTSASEKSASSKICTGYQRVPPHSNLRDDGVALSRSTFESRP